MKYVIFLLSQKLKSRDNIFLRQWKLWFENVQEKTEKENTEMNWKDFQTITFRMRIIKAIQESVHSNMTTDISKK